MNEIWKDIKGYEGLYQVSNLGKVKRLSRIMIDSLGRKINISEKILKPSFTTKNNGYYLVKLTKNKKSKMYLLHVLVAKNFIPNPLGLPQVNHKDENKLNNSLNNLEWCTVKYNNNYGTKRERLSKNHSLAGTEKTMKKVMQFDKNLNLLNEFNSLSEAAKVTNTCINSISMCCNNKKYRKYANNFIWKFKEEKGEI